MDKTYPVTYSIHFHDPPLTREAVEASGDGAADAIFIASIIRPPDGSLSVLFTSQDGHTGKELTDEEFFKVWMLLTKRLSDSTTLSVGKREFTKFVFETFRKALLGEG